MLRKLKLGICSKCGELKLIVNKGLKLCAKDDLRRKDALYASRRKERAKQGKVVDKAEMAKFFKKYWAEHTDRRCFESDEPIYTYRSYHFHHCLEKHLYPKLAYEESNIIYLTLYFHSLWHSLTEKERAKQMPKTWKKYEQTKKRFLGVNA